MREQEIATWEAIDSWEEEYDSDFVEVPENDSAG